MDKQEFPEWAEVEFYQIERLKSDNPVYRKKTTPKEVMFVIEGESRFEFKDNKVSAKAGEHFKIITNKYKIIPVSLPVTIVIIGGKWSSETGTRGVFELNRSISPKNSGDPVDYSRNTKFDNHFHDCDEYWIIVEGRGKAVSEGTVYQLAPGACIATKRGDHHDIPRVEEPLNGVWFETTLYGKKREGHLYHKV